MLLQLGDFTAAKRALKKAYKLGSGKAEERDIVVRTLKASKMKPLFIRNLSSLSLIIIIIVSKWPLELQFIEHCLCCRLFDELMAHKLYLPSYYVTIQQQPRWFFMMFKLCQQFGLDNLPPQLSELAGF